MSLQVTGEAINGFMSVMHKMDWNKGLTLLLHTPGGITNAIETIIEYLNSKFPYFEVIVPTFAMDVAAQPLELLAPVRGSGHTAVQRKAGGLRQPGVLALFAARGERL